VDGGLAVVLAAAEVGLAVLAASGDSLRLDVLAAPELAARGELRPVTSSNSSTRPHRRVSAVFSSLT